MTMEQEMYIVLLTIRLEDSMLTDDKKETNPAMIRNKEDMITVLKYASE
jgi:hypothetical protein